MVALNITSVNLTQLAAILNESPSFWYLHSWTWNKNSNWLKSILKYECKYTNWDYETIGIIEWIASKTKKINNYFIKASPHFILLATMLFRI